MGGASATLYQFDGVAANWGFGFSISAAGDVDGDGTDDVIVGMASKPYSGTQGPGQAFVYSGLDGSLLHVFSGQYIGSYFGRSVGGAGDVNGDGFDDLVVGGDNNAGGVAFVYSGLDGSLLYQWDGILASSSFGGYVAGAGDVNGDGFDDVLVSDPSAMTGTGSVHVFSGMDGSKLYQMDGEAGNSGFGGSISGAGDVDGDGFDDLVVGADRYSAPGTSATYGATFVYSGVDGSHRFQQHVFWALRFGRR